MTIASCRWPHLTSCAAPKSPSPLSSPPRLSRLSTATSRITKRRFTTSTSSPRARRSLRWKWAGPRRPASRWRPSTSSSAFVRFAPTRASLIQRWKKPTRRNYRPSLSSSKNPRMPATACWCSQRSSPHCNSSRQPSRIATFLTATSTAPPRIAKASATLSIPPPPSRSCSCPSKQAARAST